MAKVTNEQILQALQGVQTQLNSFEKRISNLEKNRTNTPKSVKGNSQPTTKVVESKGKKSIKDFAPKAQDTNYSWSSYKANRLKYCYYVATNGKAQSSNDCYKQGIAFESIKNAFEKAKAQFNKQYKYVPKADR